MTREASNADERAGMDDSDWTATAVAGTDRTDDERGMLSLYARYRYSRLTTLIQATCFWMAIVLPFLYVPLLVARIGTRSEGFALVALLAVNVVALLAGHPFRSE